MISLEPCEVAILCALVVSIGMAFGRAIERMK